VLGEEDDIMEFKLHSEGDIAQKNERYNQPDPNQKTVMINGIQK
jgi:hypothetical protein